MTFGPEEGKKRQQNVQTSPSSTLGNLLRNNRAELCLGIQNGTVPATIKQQLAAINLAPTDILDIVNDAQCFKLLGDCLNVPEIRTSAPSLQQLESFFNEARKPTEDTVIRLCELLLSTTESTPLAAMVLASTLYPAFDECPNAVQLRNVVQGMRKHLSSRAFDAWTRLAADSVLWGYGSPLLNSCPGVYIEAIRLPEGCFGSLRDSQVRLRAVAMVREFIPVQKLDGSAVVAYRLPVHLWDGFPHDSQRDIVRELDIQRDVIPWMRALLKEIKNDLVQCSELCSGYKEEYLTTQWRPHTYWDELRGGIGQRFGTISEALSEVSRVSAIKLEHTFEDQKTSAKERKLRTKLQKDIAEDIVETLTALCACVSEAPFHLRFSNKLTLALAELIERLELPLDLSMENVEGPDQVSFYRRHLLPCFRHVLAQGDLQSAINIRRLFPEEVSSGGRRDAIDQYIDDNQPEMVAGVEAASRALLTRGELGPEQDHEIESFRSALLYLVHAEAFQQHQLILQHAVARVVRSLVARDCSQHTAGFSTHWGCIKAGLVFQRLSKNTHLAHQVALDAFGGRDQSFLHALSRCMVEFNRDSDFGSYRAPIMALWSACKKFHDKLPAPKTEYLSGIGAMKGHIDAAYQKWRGHNPDEVSTEQVFKHVGLFLDAAVKPATRTAAEPLIRTRDRNEEARKAHGASILARAEHLLEEVGSSLSATSYQAHTQYLLSQWRGMSLNLDSADVTPNQFQGVFAELLVGLLWGSEGLAPAQRATMAGSVREMLVSKRSELLCTSRQVREALEVDLRALYSYKDRDNEEIARKLGTLMSGHAIKDLLVHWGYEIPES